MKEMSASGSRAAVMGIIKTPLIAKNKKKERGSSKMSDFGTSSKIISILYNGRQNNANAPFKTAGK
jgi:hypothetical protein